MSNREKKPYANIELEKKVLAYYIRCDSTIAVRLDYFTIEEARQLFLFAQKHRKLASVFREWWDIWKVELQRTNHEPEPYRKFLRSLFVEDEPEQEKIDYYLEQLRGFAEARELWSVYSSSISLFKQGKVVEARQILENGVNQLRQDFVPETISRSDFVQGFGERYKTYKKRKHGVETSKIPTGIRKLDTRIDGVAPASLNVIQGETSIGKTFLLQEIAFKAFQGGLKTLFITVEMQKAEIETRWDGRLLGAEYSKVDKGELTREEEAWWRKRIRDFHKLQEAGGRLATAFIPEGCTVASIESEIDYWEQKWEAKIDEVLIDYSDLMETKRRIFSEQDAQGSIYRDLKRLSQVRNLIIWTNTQVSGMSYGKRRLDLRDTGYSKRKVNWANLVLGIGGDPEDIEIGIMRIYVAKNTFGPRGFEIVLYSDFARAMVDIEEDKRIRRRKVRIVNTRRAKSKGNKSDKDSRG